MESHILLTKKGIKSSLKEASNEKKVHILNKENKFETFPSKKDAILNSDKKKRSPFENVANTHENIRVADFQSVKNEKQDYLQMKIESIKAGDYIQTQPEHKKNIMS